MTNILNIGDTRTSNDFSYVLPFIKEADNYKPPLFEKNKCGLYMNYSLYGPSPKCLTALDNINKKNFFEYAYGGNLMINKVISKYLNLDENMILVDHGAATVLNQIFRITVTTNDDILIPSPGWSYYRSIASLIGANCIEYNVMAKEDRYEYCENEILEKLNESQAKLLVITSPNMPTGNIITQEHLEFIAKKAKDTLILVDEAYYGFTDEYAFDINYLIENYSNLVFVRTLSKLYGLASERIGFCISNPNLISLLRKTAPLFGISYTSQKITEVALQDTEYYENITKKTIQSRENLAIELKKLGGYIPYKSEGNFLLIKSLNHPSEGLVKYFDTNGYIIRDCSSGYNLKSHIRISIGTEEINERIIKLFKEFEKIHNYSELSVASKGIVLNDNDDFEF